MVWIGSGSERRNESAKNTITIVPKYSLGPQYLSSSLVWLDPILNMLLLVHMSMLTDRKEIYPITPSFHFQGTQNVLLCAQAQCFFIPHTHIHKLLSCLSFAVQKPDTFDGWGKWYCCPAQKNWTFILVCTIFDKQWRQRKKAAYWPNYFVCTKTKFLNGDQVTQDYLPGLSRIWILNNYSITEFLTFLNHEFNLFQNLLQAETGWWSRPGSNWHDHQLHWTDSTNWKQLKMGLNNEINKFRKKWIFFEVIMQGFIFES